MNGYSTGDGDEGKGKHPEEIAMVPKPGWGSKDHHYDDDDGEELEQQCGVGSCRPTSMKRMTGIWSFTAMFGLSTMLASSTKTYLLSQVIFVERQYELSKKTVGMLLSCADISFLVFVMFTSYYARKKSIPKVLGISTVTFAIACIICVMPHAITKDDLHPPPVVNESDSVTMEKLLLKSPSCMISNLPKEAIQEVMAGMGGGGGLPIMPFPPMLPPKQPENPSYQVSTQKTPASTSVSVKDLPQSGGEGAETKSPGGDKTPITSAPEKDTPSPAVQTTKALVPQTLAPQTPAPTPKPQPVQPVAQPTGEIIMPNFTKLATHPNYESMANTAMKMFNLDIRAIAKMPLKEQVKIVNNLPDNIKAMLPSMKMLLGENADSYFMRQPTYSRRKRAAEKKRIDPATDLMHNGMLASMFKGKTDALMPKSKIDAMFKKLCPFNTHEFHKCTNSASIAVMMIVVGMIVQGIARAPRLAFATTYVDDNVAEPKTALHLGMIMSLGTLGQAFAMAMGGLAATSYVTLEDTGHMTFFNPRWLSAWWVGYLIYGVFMLLLALPILMFPRRLPTPDSPYSSAEKKREARKMAQDSTGFVQSLVRLVTNPVFLLLVLANAASVLAMAGVIAYLGVYVEQQFSLPPFQASVILGFVYVVVSALGTVAGGFVASRWQLSPEKCLKLTVVVAVIITVVHACTLALGCDQPKIDKGDKIVGNTSTTLCINTCICVDEMYAPVCGSDGISYYSPCHAGCGEAYDGKFHDCKCVEDKEKTVVPLLCKQPCDLFHAYCVFLVLGGFLIHLSLIPAFLAMFRSVEARDAPLAVGFNSFFVTLLGAIPSPYLFGAIVDGVCTLTRLACGPVGTCASYDIVKMRLNFNGVATAIKFVAALLYVGAMLLGRRSNSVFRRSIHEK